MDAVKVTLAGRTQGLEQMAWTELQYTKPEINRAARTYLNLLVSGPPPMDWENREWALYDFGLNAINNWRAVHAYPLNILQNNLRRAARNFDDAPVIAQRTKRLFSIINKLIHLPKMKLTQMQDIGGCRAIVHSVKQVRELDRFYAKKSRMKHEFSSRDDYILNPPPSGYRGIHLVYRFFSDKASGAKYNGLKIKMQLRSQYQHA